VRRVTVGIPGAAYDVLVGAGTLADVGRLVADRRRVAVVSQRAVLAAHDADVRAALEGARVEHSVFVMGDGEEAKTLSTVEGLARELAAWGLLRDDAIVALGGGVVGDTAGLLAAVYHRGIAVLQVPTTLLAQVDAGVGGKTAVNLPEGKNLVGAFHQPIAVVADVMTLRTLPEREFRAGLGEVAKYALMPDGDRVGNLVRDRPDAIRARDPHVLVEVVAECVAIKAAIVAADPEERTGIRAALNYGHTLAHALETVGGYNLQHGEAVAIGVVFAGALAVALERLPATAVDDHRALVESLGLPTVAPSGLDAADLARVMGRDKKARGGLSFVLAGERGLETVHDPRPGALASAFAAVGVAGDVEG
jgi:3-dehydroquinate synthase